MSAWALYTAVVYAAPSPSNIPYRAQVAAPPFAPIGSGLRTAFGIVVGVATLSFFVCVGLFSTALIMDADSPDEGMMIGAGASFVLAILLLYTQMILGVVWIYKAWKWLPADQRYTRHWKGFIEPGAAAGMMLIPYFHYYWMFVIDCGLCDALDRMSAIYPTRQKAPKEIAIAAGICQLIIPMPVGAFLWWLYMTRIEKMTREMSDYAGHAAHAAQLHGAPML